MFFFLSHGSTEAWELGRGGTPDTLSATRISAKEYFHLGFGEQSIPNGVQHAVHPLYVVVVRVISISHRISLGEYVGLVWCLSVKRPKEIPLADLEKVASPGESCLTDGRWNLVPCTCNHEVLPC